MVYPSYVRNCTQRFEPSGYQKYCSERRLQGQSTRYRNRRLSGQNRCEHSKPSDP
jgi:hypothetical protein